MAGFSVGEIAIYWRPGVGGHNTEVEITGTLAMTKIIDCDGHVTTDMVYPVHTDKFTVPEGFKTFLAQPRYLRKRPEPGTWENCVWQPNTRMIAA